MLNQSLKKHSLLLYEMWLFDSMTSLITKLYLYWDSGDIVHDDCLMSLKSSSKIKNLCMLSQSHVELFTQPFVIDSTDYVLVNL